MESLTLQSFDAHRDAFDALALNTPEIDHFCSSSSWIVPAHHAFLSNRKPLLLRGEHGFVAMMREGSSPTEVWQPLEPMWGLACPLLTTTPELFAREWLAHITAHEQTFDAMLLTGMKRDSLLWRAVGHALLRRYQVYVAQPTRRHTADLSQGYDAYLARRSKSFRRTLKRAQERAKAQGITFERADNQACYARLLAAEKNTWKGQEAVGFGVGDMKTFYDAMLPRLIAKGALRVLFARQAEQDVGFLFGGILGTNYRALQFGYHHALAHVGLGHLLQVTEMQHLVQEGVLLYDLGSDVDYKRHFGDAIHETQALVVRRT